MREFSAGIWGALIGVLGGLIVVASALPFRAGTVSLDDVDWAAWQKFYEEGRSPRPAIHRALERDL